MGRWVEAKEKAMDHEAGNHDDERAARVEPQTLAFLQALETQQHPPFHTLTPTDARHRLRQIQMNCQVATLPVAVEERTIPTGPTGAIALRMVRPPASTGNLPGIIYFPGGRWLLGVPESHDRLVRELVNGTQSTLILVDYDRAPAARYPLALEQAYSATAWVADQGTAIGVDPSRLAVVGDSEGGNLATVVTLLAKQRQGPKLIFQVLFYPVTDAELDNASYHQFGGGAYWLTRADMIWFWDNYAAVEQRKAPTVAPLQATLAQLQGLPPALIITAENDPLREEGEAYVHKLIQAGVTVTATRYLGAIHDFVTLNPITHTPAPRAAIAQTTAALRNAFAR